MIQVEWSDYSSIMPDHGATAGGTCRLQFLPLNRIKFNTTDAVDRHGYRLAHFLQKMQTTGCKSFFTVCHINVSCSEIGNTQMFFFPGFCHGMDGSTKNREGSKLRRRQNPFFGEPPQQRKGQMDGCAAQCYRFLPERMENTGNIIFVTDVQHLCSKFQITLCLQILFPQNQGFWVSLADAGNLFRIRMCGQMPVCHSQKRYCITHKYSHS